MYVGYYLSASARAVAAVADGPAATMVPMAHKQPNSNQPKMLTCSCSRRRGREIEERESKREQREKDRKNKIKERGKEEREGGQERGDKGRRDTKRRGRWRQKEKKQQSAKSVHDEGGESKTEQ